MTNKTDTLTSKDRLYEDGELWSFIRRCMSQGKDIHLDHAERTYEEYSARLDLAALELVPELQAYIVRAVVADRRAPEAPKPASNPMADIATERRRQVEKEGYDAAHDDEHKRGEIASAAIAYALNSVRTVRGLSYAGTMPTHWPWEKEGWKPATPRHDLVKAGALIVAEIERIDRAAGIKPTAPETPQPASNGRAKSIQEAMDLADRHRTQPNPSRGNYSCHPWWVVVLADEVIRLRATPETRPTRDVEHCDYPDYERHWTAVVAQARELLEPLAEHDPEIRKWLRTAGLPPAQETRVHPRHWHCDTHGDFDAMVAVGCPECMRAARVVLRKIAADELTRTEMRIAAQEIVRPASPMSDTPNTQKASARQVGCEDANRLLRIHTETCDVCRTEKASEPLPCEHLRSERLGTKSSPDGDPLFEMRKCLDCTKIFRVRLTQKASEPPMTLGRLVLETARGNVKERTVTGKELAEIRANMERYFKGPLQFREPQTDSEGPVIYDAVGNQVAMLFWPTHPVEETEAAEQATYTLGRAMAAGASSSEDEQR